MKGSNVITINPSVDFSMHRPAQPPVWHDRASQLRSHGYENPHTTTTTQVNRDASTVQENAVTTDAPTVGSPGVDQSLGSSLSTPPPRADQELLQPMENNGMVDNSRQIFQSPTSMDPVDQEQGEELHEVLKLFKQATSNPLSACLLQTPKHKAQAKVSKEIPKEGSSRQSPELKAKKGKDKSITRLAQDLVVKKCGLIQE
jgi:hypothetical protein